MQSKAVRFALDVLDDPDLADEIDDLILEEYARRKKGLHCQPSGKEIFSQHA